MTTFRLDGTVLAGQRRSEALAGAAVRIMTGAPMPPGGDTVIPIEQIVVDGDVARIGKTVTRGDHVRGAGDDARAGEALARAGARLGAFHVAALLAAGPPSVSVVRRPRVAVIVTGGEVVADGPAESQIVDSAGPLIIARIKVIGGCVVWRRFVGDSHDEFRRSIEAGQRDADLVVTIGGLGLGDTDFVSDIVREYGSVTERKLRLKPGKPFAFGLLADGRFCGLPGNPGAAAAVSNCSWRH